MWKKMILCVSMLILVMGLFSLPALAQGATVGANCIIAWNANTETDLLNYRLYGTLQPPAPGVLISKTLDVAKPPQGGPTASTTCAAIGLTTGGTLGFQVDAVDTLGNRSIKSVLSTHTQDVSAPAQPTGMTVTPSP
jgi:hypothetical protein